MTQDLAKWLQQTEDRISREYLQKCVVYCSDADAEDILRESQPIIDEEHRRMIAALLPRNPPLQREVHHEATITDMLVEASQVYDGYRILLPHKKDTQHNEAIDDLAMLVGDLEGYKTHGFFALDNLAAAGIYSIPAGAIASGIVSMSSYSNIALPGIIGWASATMTLAFASPTVFLRQNPSHAPLDKAHYLDERIAALYPASVVSQ